MSTTAFNFEAPQEVVQVLANFFNDHHVHIFFSKLDKLLCLFVEDVIRDIMSSQDDNSVKRNLQILYDVLQYDPSLANVVKRDKKDFLDNLAQRIGASQGEYDISCSTKCIWIIRQICPELLPRISYVAHPVLLEQLLQANSDYLKHQRDVEAYEVMNLAVWALDSRQREEGDNVTRCKLTYAALELLNRCVVECQRPSRIAVDHLLKLNIVPLLAAGIPSETQRWYSEEIAKEAAELAIALASVKLGREQLLQHRFHDVLMQGLLGINNDKNRKWLVYCVGTIGGPAAILECIHGINTHTDMEHSVGYMRVAFQVLCSYVGDRMNDDAYSPEEGTALYTSILSRLASYLQIAYENQDNASSMEILPDLMRALQCAVNKLSYLPKTVESTDALTRALQLVFQTMQAKSKFDEVVQTAVMVIGAILDSVPVPANGKTAIMEELAVAHRHHLSNKLTQHWILWTVLVVTDLPTMLLFMKEHIDSPSVQEGAICSLGEYYAPENSRLAEDLQPISEAVHFVSRAMQRFPPLRKKGVETLGALASLYQAEPPQHAIANEVATAPRIDLQNMSYEGKIQIVEQIVKVIKCTDRDSMSAREECIKALRQILEGGSKDHHTPVPDDCLETILEHLRQSLPASAHPELFVDALWVLGYSRGPGEICRVMEDNRIRVGLYKCAFNALRDLYNRSPALIHDAATVKVYELVEFTLWKWPYIDDAAETARLMQGMLASMT